jgi:hypothetical protein
LEKRSTKGGENVRQPGFRIELRVPFGGKDPTAAFGATAFPFAQRIRRERDAQVE